MKSHWLISIFILFFVLIAKSQTDGLNQEIHFFDDTQGFSKKVKSTNKFKDSLSILNYANSLQNYFHKKGCWQAEFKIDRIDTISFKLSFYVGDVFKIQKLSHGNLPYHVAKLIDFKSKYYSGKPYNHTQLANTFYKAVLEAQNAGHPFASICLDSIQFKDSNTFSASVNYQAGSFITFDTLFIASKGKVNRKFIENYLRIKPGYPFDYRKYKNIRQRLNALPFLNVNGDINLFFTESRSRIEIPLVVKKANIVDGVVGFLPNPTKKGSFMFTGEFNLQLRNLFQTGKTIKVEWKSFQQQSQSLLLNYTHPLVFGTPLELDFLFDFFKQDSSFYTLQRKISIAYQFNSGAKLFYRLAYNSSRTGALTQYKGSTSLPSVVDNDIITNGFGFDYSKYDNFNFPRKGGKFKIDISAGNKIIIKNANFDPKAYENVILSTPQYKADFYGDKFFKLSPNTTIQLKTSASKIFNKQMFQNDLYRLGGLKTMRGFNENFFYASEFLVSGMELRQYFDNSSYVLLFFEQSALGYKIKDKSFSDKPTGVGAGLSFESGTGVFTFVYSLGNSSVQKMNFNQSRIHFGLISRF